MHADGTRVVFGGLVHTGRGKEDVAGHYENNHGVDISLLYLGDCRGFLMVKVQGDEAGTCGGLNVSCAGGYGREHWEVHDWYNYKTASELFSWEEWLKRAAAGPLPPGSTRFPSRRAATSSTG